MKRNTTLDWFPVDVALWDTRLRGFTSEEEGAIWRLFRLAWRGRPPCTIPSNEQLFRNELGARWRRLMPAVRSVFVPHENPELLHSPWLEELLQQQLSRGRIAAVAVQRNARPGSYRRSRSAPCIIISVAAGGSDADDNYQVLCEPCNLSKGARLSANG